MCAASSSRLQLLVWQRFLPHALLQNMAASSSAAAPVVAAVPAVAAVARAKAGDKDEDKDKVRAALAARMSQFLKEARERKTRNGQPLSKQGYDERIDLLEEYVSNLAPRNAAKLRAALDELAAAKVVHDHIDSAAAGVVVEVQQVSAKVDASELRIAAHIDKLQATLQPAMSAGVPLSQIEGETLEDYKRRLDVSAMHVRTAKAAAVAKDRAARAVAKAEAKKTKAEAKTKAAAETADAPPRAKARAKAGPAAVPAPAQQPVQQPAQQPDAAADDAGADDAGADDAHSQHSSYSDSSYSEEGDSQQQQQQQQFRAQFMSLPPSERAALRAQVAATPGAFAALFARLVAAQRQQEQQRYVPLE